MRSPCDSISRCCLLVVPFVVLTDLMAFFFSSLWQNTQKPLFSSISHSMATSSLPFPSILISASVHSTGGRLSLHSFFRFHSIQRTDLHLSAWIDKKENTHSHTF